MAKRRASVDTDDLRGVRSGTGPPDRSESTTQIPVRSRELPSWFERFVNSNAERDVLLKVRHSLCLVAIPAYFSTLEGGSPRESTVEARHSTFD